MSARFIPISDCSICTRLDCSQTSFAKGGHPEETRYLPPETSKLVDVVPKQDSSKKYQRCPICSTIYFYRSTYEYLVYGSEDEEEVRRVTPAHARKLLSDEEYVAMVEFQKSCLAHSSDLTRRLAANCVVADRFLEHDAESVVPYLTHSDYMIVRGALDCVSDQAGEGETVGNLWPLRTLIEALSTSADEPVKLVASYAHRAIERYSRYMGLVLTQYV